MRPSFSRPTPLTDSRFIESMRYAHDAKILELVIRGTRYRYYGVGERKATRLAAAPSAGAYYNAQIKGRHPRRKFSAPKPEITPEAAATNVLRHLKPARVRREEALAGWARVSLSDAGLPFDGGVFHYGDGSFADLPHLVELTTGEVITQADVAGNPIY